MLAIPGYGEYISHLVQYSTGCGSYHPFFSKVLLCTKKLLNQWFLVISMLKSSLRMFHGHQHGFVNQPVENIYPK